MLGRPRTIAPNFPHHVVARSNRGLTVFHDDEDFLSFLKMMAGLKKRRNLKIWAFCLMSNHVHLLLVPEERDDLIKYMQGLLVSYTQYYNTKYQTEGQLWKSRYFSSIVDQERYLWQVLRYIERNPVRAGIVSAPEDYPFSSASKNGICSYFLDQPPFSPEQIEVYKQWRSIPEPPELLKFLRESTKKSWPIGDRKFCEGLGYVKRPRGRPRKNRI
jgi:putative transposase